MKLIVLTTFFIFLDYSSFYWNKENCSLYLNERDVENVDQLNYISFGRPRAYILLISLAILLFVSINGIENNVIFAFIGLYLLMTVYSVGEVIWFCKYRKH